MIPLRDLNPTRRRPIVTYSLIAVNVAVWLYQFSLNGLTIGGATPEFQYFVYRWGVIPYYLTVEPTLGSLLTPFTSMFMHGGWLHLIGNMWFLHVFGDNIEDELGHARYLLFYLLSGLGAVALQVAIDPASTVPMVGASGAIAGVLGGYLMLHPRARIITLVPIFIFVQFVELPAFLFLFVWFGLQLLYGMTSLGLPEPAGGVAFFAHVGGFVVGLALVRFMRLPQRARRGGAIEPELRRRPRHQW
ncbi:MAG TPA: rhomboid family intramembrane serine protease [Sandaracinaceae bacterium]